MNVNLAMYSLPAFGPALYVKPQLPLIVTAEVGKPRGSAPSKTRPFSKPLPSSTL